MKSYITLLFPMLVCAFHAQIVYGNGLPQGFVYVDAFIPDIRLEIRYASHDNFVGRPVDGYEAPKCILSIEAATALKDVQQALRPFGLGLKIYDAYRPQRAVDHFVRWVRDLDDTKMKSRYYPGVEKKHLFRDGYIAAKSGHSRGSTVDITLVSLDGENPMDLDMGTGWDHFGPESWPGYPGITPAQRAHRMLLQTVMVQHGFKPLKEEWWHFTLENEAFPDTYFDFPVK